MDSGKLIFLLPSLLFLFQITLSQTQQKDAFAPVNCTYDYECLDLCHQGQYLNSRCDVNGTCICDCSDPDAVTSSYTSACTGSQPEGYWWDQCDFYCRQEYKRPCRYCTTDKIKFYCTCVCNYGSKVE